MNQSQAISPAVIDYLTARTPPDSLYATLVFFLRRGQVVLQREKQTDLEAGRVSETLSDHAGLPCFTLHIDAAWYQENLQDNIPAQAALLVAWYVEKLCVSPRHGSRRDFAEKRAQAVAEGRGLFLDVRRQTQLNAAAHAGQQDFLFGLVANYDIREDPDRIYLQAVYHAIRRLPVIRIERGEDLLAWYRYLLEGPLRQAWPLDEVLVNISRLFQQAVQPEGTRLGEVRVFIRKALLYQKAANPRFVFPYQRADYQQGQVIFIPQSRLAPDPLLFDLSKEEEDFQARQIPPGPSLPKGGGDVPTTILHAARRLRAQRKNRGDPRAVVIGILAPAGAGKTTLAQNLTRAAQAAGLRAAHVSGDGYLQPGRGFRYDYVDGYRHTRIWGPGIYDDIRLCAVLARLKHGGTLDKAADVHTRTGVETIGPNLELIISDGVFIGLDKALQAQLDILVCLQVDEHSDVPRLALKWQRDSHTASTHTGTDLALDFAEKQFHENHDGMQALIPERADFVWVRNTRTLYVRSALNLRLQLAEALQILLNNGDMCGLQTLAARAPIFSRGWLAQALEAFPAPQQAVLRTHLNTWLDSVKPRIVTLIPVGGRGSRFAPFSWAVPKPFCRLFGHSHFIHAVRRTLAGGRRPADIFLFIETPLIAEAERELAAAGIAIPADNFIPEYAGHVNGKTVALEKAALFGMAALYIRQRCGDKTVIVTERTDLVLTDAIADLNAAIKRAATLAAVEPAIGLLGNPPLPAEKQAILAGQQAPDMNKGYIDAVSEALPAGLFSVRTFHEKPADTPAESGAELARRYLREGATYNGSYFIFQAGQLLKLLADLRPEDYRQLQRLEKGREYKEIQAVYDYFCGDSQLPVAERHIALSFEHAVVQVLAPAKGPILPQAGVIVAPLTVETAKSWVGSQGTLQAVWPQEKVGKNYIRAEGRHIRSRDWAAYLKGVTGCHILLAPDDQHTCIYAHGVRDLVIAYEHRKRALIVVPVTQAKAVGRLTQAVQADPQLSAFAEPGADVPRQAREPVEILTTGSNVLKLGPDGFGLILASEATTVHSEAGFIGVIGVRGLTICKTLENGTDVVHVHAM